MKRIEDEFSDLHFRKAYYRRNKKRGLNLLYAARRRAKQFNLPINITIDDIIIPELCPILNIPFDTEVHDNKPGHIRMNCMSLDRVIPELGYVKGNVRVISFQANKYKNNMSRETIQKLLDYIDGKL